MQCPMKRLAFLAVVAAAVVGAGAALAGTHVATTARLVGVTSPARRNAEASLIARVAPARRCTIAVLYKSGPSHAQGLGPKRPTHGVVVWNWRVGGNTTLGKWPIQVNCGSAGSFRTHFRVIR
jgi:micrococcal nuclease